MELSPLPLTATAFSPFGDIIDTSGEPDKIINQGLCGRFHDRAQLDFSNGAAGISLFKAEPRQLPMKLDLVERHPEGSQCFIPMSMDPFLVIVAEDNAGTPGTIHAFITQPGQAINFHRNIWHGVLTPLFAPGLFAVVDRIGNGTNLEEFWLTEEVTILPLQ
ncbi:ureidoglycolate lyase [Cochlodiniinecator piscidefendens]|uniref:ureidoglycolate lyase n=1 Tax=Cochlodiniinecator piscidefendens TaxID=2715756 RepID=UPI00140A3A0E|nr:ureidoglycolate lyase [Cochlodiniinecator piscidefendens]